MLPSIPIPSQHGKSNLAPYRQNMKKSFTSGSRWAAEAQGRVDHKSKARLQPRSQSVPLVHGYDGMDRIRQRMPGSAFGYADETDEDQENSNISHISHRMDYQHRSYAAEQQSRRMQHPQPSRLTDYDKMLFSSATLSEVPWQKQREGPHSKLQQADQKRAEKRVEYPPARHATAPAYLPELIIGRHHPSAACARSSSAH